MIVETQADREIISMSNFKEQIREDIQLIQKDYGYIDDNLRRDDFAFNYWVLSRLYGMDEEIIASNVTDINDKCIDCFVHYEDTKELYLIQNKYYDDFTSVDRRDVADFLKTPLSILSAGRYKRSEELQKIFDRIHSDSDYKIWLHFYVTNDLVNQDVESLINQFSFSEEKVKAFVGVKYYKLSDISRIYFGDRFTNKIPFTTELTTRVSATSLDVRPKDYKLDWMIDLRFVMVNVADLYLLYKKAIEKNYELFEENVREFLGTQGINNGIIKTLRSSTDRENFFYYNNGITLICEKCETLRGTEASKGSKGSRNQYGFRLTNPQIVNGCQTINSIAEVLAHCNESDMLQEFEKAYVLVKIYVFDEDTKNEKEGLDKNIVKYTNSQNSIDEKAFASKQNYFLNLQEEFKKRGVLLLVKPSDKNIFTVEYKDKAKFAALRKRGADLFQLFDIDGLKLKNYMIPLEKMLKVLLAFCKNGFYAFSKGSTVLKLNSPYYKDFSLNIDQQFTIDNMIKLYFLFNRADIDQKASSDKRTPIPYYVIGFLGKRFKDMEFSQRNERLKRLFANKQTMLLIYEFYKNLTPLYAEEYLREKGEEYNSMIKQEIDDALFDRIFSQMLRFGANETIKKFLQEVG